MKRILIGLVFAAALAAQPAGYTQSGRFVIDHTKVSADQLNFPVAINAYDPALRDVRNGGQMQNASGYDILFSSDAAGVNLLSYERVLHDTFFGRIFYWVKLPTLSSSVDTSIYVWYGNSSVSTDQSNPTAVWDSSYLAVWHLADSAANQTVADSTGNGHTGINQANTSTKAAEGTIANLTTISYNGPADYTSFPYPDLNFTSQDFSFELWLKPTQYNAYQVWFGTMDGTAGDGGYGLQDSGSGNGAINFESNNGGYHPYRDGVARPVNTWEHIAVTRTGTNLKIYRNGVQIYSTAAFASPGSNNFAFSIGAGGNGDESHPFTGLIQEFRVSSAVRPPSWITTQYNNQSSPATFFSSAPWSLVSHVPPVCNAGAWQSVKAGTTLTLDGSGSTAAGVGGPLSYMWQQVPSTEPGVALQPLVWTTAHTLVNPTVTNFVGGSLDFQLTVTQSGDGESASCVVHHGAVATDSAGNVQIPNAQMAEIVGPITQWNSTTARWPWHDEIERGWGDMLGSFQGSKNHANLNYTRQWDIPEPAGCTPGVNCGTCTASHNSAIITCTGIDVQQEFCGASGSYFPPTPVYSALWYTNPISPNDGLPTKDVTDVSLCPTSTTFYRGLGAWHQQPGGTLVSGGNQIGLSPWYACGGSPSICVGTVLYIFEPAGTSEFCTVTATSSPTITFTCANAHNTPWWVMDSGLLKWTWNPPNQSGMQLSRLYTGDITGGQSANINYYDSVLAFYTMYFRTGVDTYLSYARYLADLWWTSPTLDKGNCDNGCTAPRILALTGMYLRALDRDALAGTPGASTIWPGLYYLIMNTSYLNGWYSGNGASAAHVIGDLRESSYALMYLSLCARYDPNSTRANACRSTLNSSITGTDPYTGYSGWAPQVFPDGAFRAMANCCANVSGPYVTIGTGSPCAAGQPCVSGINLGAASTALFQSGHPLSYSNTVDTNVVLATKVDASHVQLSSYIDNCTLLGGCSGRQYVLNTDTASWNGTGVQPYMQGIAAVAFHFCYLALNMEPSYSTNANLCKFWVTGAVAWNLAHGVNSSQRALLYGVGYGQCPELDGVTYNLSCYSNANPGDLAGARELIPETIGAMSWAYLDNPSPGMLAAVDNLYSAGFAKYPGNPGRDSVYDNGMDLATSSSSGGSFFAGRNPKWHGFFWGVGRSASWLSARQGGLAPATTQTLLVRVNIASITNAAKVRVTPTDPAGNVQTPVVCISSPCSVSINPVIGNWALKIEYLSSGNQVLAAGMPFVVAVN
jgi:hypothetical protein